MRTLTLWRAYVKASDQLIYHYYIPNREIGQLILRRRRLAGKLEAEITRRLEAETQE